MRFLLPEQASALELPIAQELDIVAPASRVLLTQAALPTQVRARRRALLAFAVEQKLAVEPDSVHVAIGPQLDASEHVLAVVDREWLAQSLRFLADKGCAPSSIGVETLQVRVAPGSWTVVWQPGGSFVRTGPASGAALDEPADASPPIGLRLALETARAKARPPEKIIVRAAAGHRPDLAAWTQALGLPCLPDEAGDASAACEKSPIELLQGDFEPPGRSRNLLPRLRPARVVLCAALGLHALVTAVHWGVLRYEKHQLEAEMRERFRAAFPQAASIVDPALQMRRQLEALRRSAGQPRADDFVVLLAGVAPLLGAELKSISYEQGKLVLDVETDSRADAEALLRRAQAAGAAATLGAVNPKGKRVEARFSIGPRGGA